MSGFLLPEKEEDCMQRIKLMTDSASDLPNELAQQLGIQTQDENRPHNVVQIGAVSLQREYPLVFVLFVGQFRHQNHIDGEADFPAKISGASVAGAVDAGGDLTGHHKTPAVFRTVPSAATGSDTG